MYINNKMIQADLDNRFIKQNSFIVSMSYLYYCDKKKVYLSKEAIKFVSMAASCVQIMEPECKILSLCPGCLFMFCAQGVHPIPSPLSSSGLLHEIYWSLQNVFLVFCSGILKPCCYFYYFLS